jgi:hypothetical protein
LTSIAVTPSSTTLAAGGNQQFAGESYDQFGNLMATQPALTWSVKSGAGSIGASTGLYAAPNTAGTATVQAAIGSNTGTASVTVLPPSNGAISATAAFSVVSTWNSGFQAGITLTNTGTSAITNWILQFNFAASITQNWNATIQNHSGSQYVIDNAGANSSIAPGQSVSFGFLGSPGGIPAAPTNYLLNGVPIKSGSPPSGSLSATAAFADVNDWGTGFTGNITITNTGSAAIEGWTLSFNFGVSISSVWNGTLVNQNGSQYSISNRDTMRSSSRGKASPSGSTRRPRTFRPGPPITCSMV